MNKIILAYKRKVRREILSKYNIDCIVEHSNVDEEPVKKRIELLKDRVITRSQTKNTKEEKKSSN